MTDKHVNANAPKLESTLEVVATAERYHRWLASEIAPDVTPPVLEIGAGLGTLSMALARYASPVYASEADPQIVPRLRDRVARTVGTQVVDGAMLPLTHLPADLPEVPQTIVISNVIEHLPEDVTSLASVRNAAPSGTTLVIVAPAHSWAYGPLDNSLGHYRRYTRSSMTRALELSGWTVRDVRYFNPIGAIAWAASGRLLRRSRISPWQTRTLESLVPLLRFVGKLARGSALGQSVIGVGFKAPAGPRGR